LQRIAPMTAISNHPIGQDRALMGGATLTPGWAAAIIFVSAVNHLADL
jgi:hypothetical protein